ncbi:MAG: MFS transporter [Acidobacteria bacterium]|nr:MAG: MFS transporter [Acidobacteriota bacterium]
MVGSMPPRSPQIPVQRRERVAWCLYDFADSGFTTVIVTTFYVLYFKNVVVGQAGLGDWYWALANSMSAVVVAVLAPVLGAMADISGSKRLFLRGFGLIIIVFTASLALVGPGNVVAGIVLFMLANIGFAGGVIFIDAFLPELAEPGRTGRLSGARWAVGYVGGMLCLATIMPLASGGFVPGNLTAARSVFPVVALWYAVFSLPAFLILRDRGGQATLPAGESVVLLGFRRLRTTFRSLRRYRQLFKFLLAFWLYNDAIVTIIIFAAAFASDTLHFTVRENMLLILCVNLPAAAGALAFGALLDRLGAKRTVMLTLLLWLGVIIATMLTTSKGAFFGVAALAGIGLGSCQSSSRALLAQFTPANRAGEFFSFLGVAGKASAIMGPLVFGWISWQTGSQRLAILAVGIFFLAGLLVLATVDEEAGLAAARGPDGGP